MSFSILYIIYLAREFVKQNKIRFYKAFSGYPIVYFRAKAREMLENIKKQRNSRNFTLMEYNKVCQNH